SAWEQEAQGDNSSWRFRRERLRHHGGRSNRDLCKARQFQGKNSSVFRTMGSSREQVFNPGSDQHIVHQVDGLDSEITRLLFRPERSVYERGVRQWMVRRQALPE